ncbi:MAG: DUF4287 domain-containing protein [Rhodoglobus sp.]
MTFQAYLDSIKQKTGLEAADFRRLAADKGLLDAKASEVVAWLKEEYGLGQGHAMALFATFKDRPAASDRIDKLFSGAKARWRPAVDELIVTLAEHGAVGTAPTDTYLSLLKGKAKFAVLATTADRLDVGIKLRDASVAATSPRVEQSGSWNAMVTHRVRVTDPAQIDDELVGWLRAAYDQA